LIYCSNKSTLLKHCSEQIHKLASKQKQAISQKRSLEEWISCFNLKSIRRTAASCSSGPASSSPVSLKLLGCTAAVPPIPSLQGACHRPRRSPSVLLPAILAAEKPNLQLICYHGINPEMSPSSTACNITKRIDYISAFCS